MPINYTAPRVSQMYGNWLDANNAGPIPLPADGAAYSIGPALADTNIAVRWISEAFNLSSSANTSRSVMIKDENDFFYVIAAYRPSSTTFIWINEYDAENDVNTVHAPTPPAELASLALANMKSWHWFIRKRSPTMMDFCVYGDSADGSENVLQHYEWEIGGSTMTYLGGYSYTVSDCGLSRARTLHGPLLIDVTYPGAANDLNNKLCVHTYNLDTQAHASEELIASSVEVSWDCAVFHGGTKFYIAITTGMELSGKQCTHPYDQESPPCETEDGLPGFSEIMSQSAGAFIDIRQYNLDGTFDEFGEQLLGVVGRRSSAGALLGDEYAANPATGEVYIRMVAQGTYNPELDLIDCCLPSITPMDMENVFIRGYWKITPDSGVTFLGEGTDVSDDVYWYAPEVSGLRLTNVQQAGLLAYHGRNDPLAFMSSTITSPRTWYLLHWNSQTGTAENTIVPQSDAAPATPPGSGQRNDNAPELFAVSEKVGLFWHNKWYDDNGSLYLDQTSNIMGTSTNFLPITGMYGKWPVRHYIGRWAIFGPNTPPAEEGWARWYVV